MATCPKKTNKILSKHDFTVLTKIQFQKVRGHRRVTYKTGGSIEPPNLAQKKNIYIYIYIYINFFDPLKNKYLNTLTLTIFFKRN